MLRRITILFFLFGILLAQHQEWVARYNGPVNDWDEA